MANRKKGMTRRTFVKTTTAAAAGTVFALGGARAAAVSGDHDLVIKNGEVYDGLDPQPQKADLAVKDGRISAVGQVEGSAAETIDASGLIVAPGFIDVHTHCDLTFKRTGWKRYMAYFMSSWKGNHNYIHQGVTTVVTGNCGYGYADTAYWFDLADAVGFGTNVMHLAPHGMLREELWGQDQRTDLSAAELDRLKTRVAEEMDKGSVGLSAGLEYAPGILAPTSELIELCKVVRARGGIFTVHMRDESGKLHPDGQKGVLKSLDEVFEIARQAEIPIQISHLKVFEPINSTEPRQVLEKIEAARQEGLDITADQYPYNAGSTQISILLPPEFMTSTSIKPEYKTAEGREKVKKAIGEVFAYMGPDRTMITMYDEHQDYEGKNIADIAVLRGVSPEEAYTDMVCEDIAPVGVFFGMDPEMVKAFMPYEYVFTASDGWTVPKGMTHPHPRTYGCFPRKLGRYALQDKVLSLGEAICSMTSRPAAKFGLKDRGVLAPGKVADVVVFDPREILDQATFQEPHQYASGVVHMLVAGGRAVKDGKPGDRFGRVLARG